MAVQGPTPDRLREAADERGRGLLLTDQDVEAFIGTLRPGVDARNAMNLMADNPPPVRYPRRLGRRPSGEEEPTQRLVHKTTVEGAPSGKFKGKRVVLKDNIRVTGVAMMNGGEVSRPRCEGSHRTWSAIPPAQWKHKPHELGSG